MGSVRDEPITRKDDVRMKEMQAGESGVIRMLESAEEINPRRNPAFSPNLYRWMKRNPSRVHRVDRWHWLGTDYLGYFDEDGWFSYSRLIGVTVHGAPQTVFKTNQRDLVEAVRVPLWESYVWVGRCAIDPEHEFGFQDQRFDVVGDFRTCRWCGLRQRAVRKVRRTTYVRWVTDGPTERHGKGNGIGDGKNSVNSVCSVGDPGAVAGNE